MMPDVWYDEEKKIDTVGTDLQTVSDMVNHPPHYAGDVECIDAMVQTQGIEAVKSFCLCNAFKYLWRHEQKNGTEDVEKAIWYLNKYLELCGEVK